MWKQHFRFKRQVRYLPSGNLVTELTIWGKVLAALLITVTGLIITTITSLVFMGLIKLEHIIF